MATLSIGNEGSSLCLHCEFSERDIAKKVGGKWIGKGKYWELAFTVGNMETLLDNFGDNLHIPDNVVNRIEELTKKEEKLERIRKMAKTDTPVKLKIPEWNPDMPPYNYQKLGIMFSIANGTGVLLADDMGLGKAQPLDSKILTPNGWVEMGDIKKDSLVIGSNGESTKVTGVFPQGEKEIYKITFSDGSSTECCDEHLWNVRTPSQKKRGSGFKTMSLNDILRAGLKEKSGNRKFFIPMVQGVCLPSQEKLPLSPYLLGVLLGDGSFRENSITLTNSLKTLQDKVSLELESYNAILKVKSKDNEFRIVSSDGKHGNNVLTSIKDLGLFGKKSNEKFIPYEYLWGDCQQRYDLLHGLLDTDGYTSKDGVVEFYSTSENLADGVCHLVRSFGGVARKKVKQNPSYTYNGEKRSGMPCYVVGISLPSNCTPFGCEERIATFKPRTKYNPSRSIESIEPIGKKQAQCISVDAEDSLYVTDDFIVTHNTLQAIGTAVYKKHKEGLKQCLIVTPASLKYNWPEDIKKFTNETCVVIDGKPKEREDLWLSDAFFIIANYELIVEDLGEGKKVKIKMDDTPEQVAKKEARQSLMDARRKKLAPVARRVWGMIAADECHAIKNPNSLRTKALKGLTSKFKMGLTGTPIDGRLEELHCIMDWIVPGLFESRSRFMRRYAEQDYFGRVTGYRDIGEMKERISPFFLRRLKVDVLKDLPDKIYINRFVKLTDKEMKTYKDLAEGEHELTEGEEAIVRAIRVKQFCNHPSELTGAKYTNSKLESFKELIEEVCIDNNKKAIVFTQYSSMLHVLVDVLDKIGLKSLSIWGKTDKKLRVGYCNQFNEDPDIDVIIGTEAMSTGLNITGGDFVINYDDNWSPAIMRQREDRAYRNGRKNDVSVINMVCLDTIEQRIRDVLYSKESINDEALGDESDISTLKRMSKDEINSLIKG